MVNAGFTVGCGGAFVKSEARALAPRFNAAGEYIPFSPMPEDSLLYLDEVCFAAYRLEHIKPLKK